MDSINRNFMGPQMMGGMSTPSLDAQMKLGDQAPTLYAASKVVSSDPQQQLNYMLGVQSKIGQMHE
ncbi:MAG: hypothetical protein LWY06_09125 [Firmicutes bacterium]|nr:hypothetical protein [Bacillota bacterium]